MFFKKQKISLLLLCISGALSLNAAQANNPRAETTTTLQSSTPSSELTPMDQRFGSDQDVEITRRIRERLIGMKYLSMSAQNVKIVTLGKRVNLIGEVTSEKERADIIQAAKNVAGNSNVSSEMVVQKQ